MAKGNGIIVSADPKGRFEEIIITDTSKPGTLMEVVPATEPVSGRFKMRCFQRGSDGQRTPICILLDDVLQGIPVGTAYVANTRAQVYYPLSGEEMNVLLLDVAGTGDTHAIGDFLIAKSGSGKFVVTTGTPQSEPFIVRETLAAPTADILCYVSRT
jgi:hypothetical protein